MGLVRLKKSDNSEYKKVYVDSAKVFVTSKGKPVDDSTNILKSFDQLNGFNSSICNRLLDKLDMGGMGFDNPKTIAYHSIFHCSSGYKPQGESASIFFRVLAITTNGNAITPNMLTNPFEIKYIKPPTAKGIVELKTKENKPLNFLMSEFPYNDKQKTYALIYEIVGIGYHTGDSTYQLLCRNTNFLSSASITL